MRMAFVEILSATFLAVAAGPAGAQGAAPSSPPPTKPEMTQSCPGLVAARPPFAEPAALRLAG
jgi:hypothetical protein